MGSFERIDPFGGFFIRSELPVPQEFDAVQIVPLQDHPELAWGKASGDHTAPDLDGDPILPAVGVEVGRAVLAVCTRRSRGID